jgi:hypothetical protein
MCPEGGLGSAVGGRQDECMSTPYRETPLDPDQFTQSWTADVEPAEMQLWASKVRKPRGGHTWEVASAVLEFIREAPLVDDLNDELYRAILEVRGVKEIVGGDRELMLITGRTKGDALVRACTAVVEKYRPQIEVVFGDDV